MTHSPSLRGPLLVLAAAVMWSTGGVCIKLLSDYSTLAASAGRSLVTALFFLALLRGRVRPSRDALPAVAVGAVAYAAVVTAFVAATKLTTAANAILLQSSAPLWVAAWGFLRGAERPGAAEIASLVLGGGGMALCVLGSGGAGAATLPNARLGDVLALFSGVAFATLMVVLRGAALRAREAGSQRGDTGILVLFHGNLLSALVGIVPLLEQLPTPAIPGKPALLGWLVLIWLGVGQLGGGYWLFQRGIRTTRALTASLLALLEPVVNPVWVALVVREFPSPWTVAGGGLVIASCVLAVAGARRAEAG